MKQMVTIKYLLTQLTVKVNDKLSSGKNAKRKLDFHLMSSKWQIKCIMMGHIQTTRNFIASKPSAHTSDKQYN